VSVVVYAGTRAELGEGPRWDAAAGCLLWVDVERGELHRGGETTGFGERVGSAAPTDDGDVLVATATGLVLAGSGETLARFPHGADTRANDGACDPAGRFWIGTTALDFRDGGGALYVFDGRLECVLPGVGLSNGLGWHAERMYYVDSNTQRIDVFDWDGRPSNRRPFARVDRADGIPDGLAVDDEGGVWLALYGGSCVRRYDPDGTLVEELALPAENVTACCFGGADGRSLFVTTAAPDGRVYVADVGVSGPPAQPFRRTAPSDAEPTSAR